jgi:K+-transporting ATPase c subunit
MTMVTTVLLGRAYPLAITDLAQVLLLDQANDQLSEHSGTRNPESKVR